MLKNARGCSAKLSFFALSVRSMSPNDPFNMLKNARGCSAKLIFFALSAPFL
jgi:hypothetical protein